MCSENVGYWWWCIFMYAMCHVDSWILDFEPVLMIWTLPRFTSFASHLAFFVSVSKLLPLLCLWSGTVNKIAPALVSSPPSCPWQAYKHGLWRLHVLALSRTSQTSVPWHLNDYTRSLSPALLKLSLHTLVFTFLLCLTSEIPVCCRSTLFLPDTDLGYILHLSACALQ